MAKKRTGGLGRGFDALFSEASIEPMSAEAPKEAAQQEKAAPQPEKKVEESPSTETQPVKKVERIVIRDEELEELAAAELAAAKRATEKAEKESQEAQIREAEALKAKEEAEAKTRAQIKNAISESAYINQAEEAEKARVVERVVEQSQERKKPTKRTAAGEAEKARKQNLAQTEEAMRAQTQAQIQTREVEEKKETVVSSNQGSTAPQQPVAAAVKEAPLPGVSKINPKSPAVRVPTLSQTTSPIPEPVREKKQSAHKVSDEVPMESIRPNPDQPRTNFKREEIEELAASIERDGLLQPILVRPMGEGKYQIIAGERRWQACKEIGLKTVPVRIKQADDNLALELALIENIQRSNLNPIEEAYGYRRIMERRKITQSELAQLVSKGRSTVANALRLLDLPEDAQQLLYEEKITSGHARAILSVSSSEGKQKLTEKLVKESLSVRETENLARLYSGREKQQASEAKRTPTPKEFKMVARRLKTKLEAPVRVKTVQGKNKIEIEFADNADLERLMNLIVGDQEQA